MIFLLLAKDNNMIDVNFEQLNSFIISDLLSKDLIHYY